MAEMALSCASYSRRAQAGRLVSTRQIACSYTRILCLLVCLLPRKVAADPETGTCSASDPFVVVIE